MLKIFEWCWTKTIRDLSEKKASLLFSPLWTGPLFSAWDATIKNKNWSCSHFPRPIYILDLTHTHTHTHTHTLFSWATLMVTIIHLFPILSNYECDYLMSWACFIKIVFISHEVINLKTRVKNKEMSEWEENRTSWFFTLSFQEITVSQRVDSFELWCWRRLLKVPWSAMRSNQSILKEINLECSLEGLMLKLKLQNFGYLMRRANSLMLGKIEGRRRKGPQRMRHLDGISNSMDMSLSKLQRWWRTGKHGVLQSTGLQRVRHNWATEQWQRGVSEAL